MKAKSIKGTSHDDIYAALHKSMEDGFAPTLAIVFISIKKDRNVIAELLSQNDIDIFGVTSSGEFIDGHQSEGEIAILLLDLSRDSYSILYEDIGGRSIETTSKRIAEDALSLFRNPTMIVCSTGCNIKGEFFDGVTLVNSIEKAIGSERVFFGGMAGDDMTLSGSYVFTHHKETDHGIIGLVLDEDKVSLQGMAITGWKPMGISRKVTKSVGNLVYTIDDKPAVEMYMKYLGKGEKANDEDFNLLQELSFHFPFIVDRDEGETVIKSPLSIDYKENALFMDMEMPEGSTFWFSTPPEFDIVEEIIEEATKLKNSTQAEADALLIFSCAGRHPALGPLVTQENDGLAEVWQAPMAGFFTYGEFGRAKNGKQNFHSTACCWVVLKEK
ncbi:MAG: FIST C-terminal domain-containing protein [Saprospiraceae bacterium]|nr:FIST N-terminal domain-containing protein [Candidatus Brachybacter algidus]MBK8747598.1 FIST C-terminal domain-containing protein [Candidatus Brachybacter algidus]